MLKSGAIIGIIGGGQLARMMALEAVKLGYKICIFCNAKNSPALDVTNLAIIGDYNDQDLLKKFISQVEAVTFEFENLPYETLKFIEEQSDLNPNAYSLYISQDRVREKDFVNKLSIVTTNYFAIKSLQDLIKKTQQINYNAILKTTQLGYDGKGQFMINKDSDLEKVFTQANHHNTPLILEERVSFNKELSLILARDKKGNIAYYDLVENIHNEGILYKTIAPANLAVDVALKLNNQAQEIAAKLANKLNYIGVMAIEFFLDKAGNLIFNEFAPRPHNSGHFSIDACYHNQFEQAIRASAGLNVASTIMHSKAEMNNLIGDDIKQIAQLSAKQSNNIIKIHDYNKGEVRAKRKMGHYNILIKNN
jgi:5-(carboxyamino)imidazole ribonucleotide synthase